MTFSIQFAVAFVNPPR